MSELESAHAEMGTAIGGIQTGLAEAISTREKMIALRDAIPGAFEQAKAYYLKTVDDNSEEIEHTYQASLNVGFRQIFLLTAIGSIIGLLLLVLSGAGRRNKCLL